MTKQQRIARASIQRDELDRIKAARERNRQAMEAEAAERAAQKARDEETAKKADEFFHAGMVQMVDLVLSCPGRPLPGRTVNRLNEIRRRHEGGR